MSTAPVLKYLRIDADGEPVFDPNAQLTDADAVAQAILTRLRLFRGEWWENLNLGLPVFQSMLGQPGSARTQAAIELSIRQVIEGTPYVTEVDRIAATFVDGRFSFRATVKTSFGTVTVASASVSPASASRLE